MQTITYIYLARLLLSAYSSLCALHYLQTLEQFYTLLLPSHATFLCLLARATARGSS